MTQSEPSDVPGFAYLDASALAKLAVAEVESPALAQLALKSDGLFSSVVGAIELERVIRRIGHRRLLQRADAVLAAVFLVHLTASIRDHAGRLEPPALRTLDAIHLASAMSLGFDALTFVTYDNRLAEAARSEGLIVMQPGR